MHVSLGQLQTQWTSFDLLMICTFNM